MLVGESEKGTMSGFRAIIAQPIYDGSQALVMSVLVFTIVVPALCAGLIRGDISLSRFSTFGIYKCFKGWPFGNWVFTRLVTLFAPYTGSIYATVESLEPGKCSVVMQDR
jgi:hypothetical protein